MQSKKPYLPNPPIKPGLGGKAKAKKKIKGEKPTKPKIKYPKIKQMEKTLRKVGPNVNVPVRIIKDLVDIVSTTKKKKD